MRKGVGHTVKNHRVRKRMGRRQFRVEEVVRRAND